MKLSILLAFIYYFARNISQLQ